MELPINRNEPTTLWIDMNSCFASVEQQANHLLRGKPVAVAAYTTPSGCVVSPSIEAKRHGCKVGMTVRECRQLCRGLVVLPPDPRKYRYVHQEFNRIFKDYSPDVVPKSIDEACIEFAGTPILKRMSMVDVAKEIKGRVKNEVGDWLTVSVGISTNRFLAKLAAGLHKPDGLDVLTHENLMETYRSLELTDLCGINTRYEARLNAGGIFSPTDFYNASTDHLQKSVFKSINGYYWYLRLRGWEIDSVSFDRRSYGQMYSLPKATADRKQLAKYLMKLTEKMGSRMRHGGFAAQGVHLSCIYNDYTHWHRGKKFSATLYTSQELYVKVLLLLNSQPEWKPVSKVAVSSFSLVPYNNDQATLFDDDYTKRRRLSDALDCVNTKYGDFTITPALMFGMGNEIIDRISFGSVKEMVEEAYDDAP